MYVHLATAVATPLGCASMSAWPQSDVLLYGTLITGTKLGGGWGQRDVGRPQSTGSVTERLVGIDPLAGGGQTETGRPGIWRGGSDNNVLRYWASAMRSRRVAGTVLAL